MTVEELKLTPEFKNLSPQQQKFVLEYLTNGFDARKAVETCYNGFSGNSCRTYHYTLLSSPNIQIVLALFSGETSEETFLKSMRKLIGRGKIDPLKLDALKLYAEVAGLRKSRAIPPRKAEEGDKIPPESEVNTSRSSLLDAFG